MSSFTDFNYHQRAMFKAMYTTCAKQIHCNNVNVAADSTTNKALMG